MENSVNLNEYILELKDVSVSYTPGKNAVNMVNAGIKANTVTAIMGPSGCGKSTLLRAINRMHELYPDIVTTGEILLKGENIFDMIEENQTKLISILDNCSGGNEKFNSSLSILKYEEELKRNMNQLSL